MFTRNDYPPSVYPLFDHGPVKVKAHDIDNWFDYVGHYDLDEVDVIDLIEMMGRSRRANPKHPNDRYAPIHACRALAQLGDMVAEEYFVYLVEQGKDKVLAKNAAAALTVWGRANLANRKDYFDDPRMAAQTRIGIVEEVWQLGLRLPQLRDDCVEFLTTMLSQYEKYPYDLNGSFVLGLVKLKATEASDLIEQALASGKANDEISGSWAAVQVELGLANEDDFEPDRLLCARDRQRVLESKLAIMMPKKPATGP